MMQIFWKRKSHVELSLESLPKYADKFDISIRNDVHRKAILFLNMFEEQLSIMLCSRSVLAWNEDSHLGKYFN